MTAAAARTVGAFAPLRYLHDYDYIFRLLLAFPDGVRYLHEVAETVDAVDLVPGTDYNLVTVSFDVREGPDLALLHREVDVIQGDAAGVLLAELL